MFTIMWTLGMLSEVVSCTVAGTFAQVSLDACSSLSTAADSAWGLQVVDIIARWCLVLVLSITLVVLVMVAKKVVVMS
jgi:hypothetical protein